MERQQYDVAIVGGGIIGLSTAMHLNERFPRLKVAVLEKERELATHQTGHNSGVIHSGIYYRPGSHKANFCVAGVQKLIDFCDENEIEYERCGKVIVATDESELGRLDNLYERGVTNGVQGLEMIGPERLREIEPHSAGIRALWSPGTGIADYVKVAQTYASRFAHAGGRRIHRSPSAEHHQGRRFPFGGNGQGNTADNPHHQLRRTVRRPRGANGGRPGRRADRALPRRVLHHPAREPPSGLRPHLPGAGPEIPLPRCALHTEYPWLRRGRSERGAGVQSRGLPQERHQCGGNPGNADVSRLLEG